MDTGHQLLNLEESAFVRLVGDAPADGDWHVNEHVIFSTGDRAEGMMSRVIAGGSAGDGARHGYVLQRADATHEWLVVVVDETHEGGDLTTVARFPDLASPAEELDTDFEVASIAGSVAELGE